MVEKGDRNMNCHRTIEDQLSQLGDELASTSDFSRRVMIRIAERTGEGPPTARTVAQVQQSPWLAPALLAASVLICVGVWWLSRPTPLYARMLAALAEAKTVHVTGWTRHIARKWPLEGKPAMNLAARWPDGKYPIEMWHWTEADGTTRSYEQTGPVILVRHGGDSKEYQEDADLTWIYEGGYSKDRVEEYGGLGEYFAALQRLTLKNEDLGTREEAGRKLRGVRHSETNQPACRFA